MEHLLRVREGHLRSRHLDLREQPSDGPEFPAPETTTNYQFGTVYYADQFTFDADVYYIPIHNNYIAADVFAPTPSEFVLPE